MISFIKSFATTDGAVFATIEMAQAHEIKLILATAPFIDDPASTGLNRRDSPNVLAAFAKLIIDHGPQIVDLLTTTSTSKLKARRINGGRKTRKTKENMSERQEQDRIDMAKKKTATEATV